MRCCDCDKDLSGEAVYFSIGNRSWLCLACSPEAAARETEEQIQDAYAGPAEDPGEALVWPTTPPGGAAAEFGAVYGRPDPRTAAKTTKRQPQLTPFEFVMAMGDVFEEGLTDGRKPHGWQALDSAEVAHDYRGALLRHYHAGEWAAVAVNACILWWHERKASDD